MTKAILYIKDISGEAKYGQLWAWELETSSFRVSQLGCDPCMDRVIILGENAAEKLGLKVEFRFPPFCVREQSSAQIEDRMLLTNDWRREMWDNP